MPIEILFRREFYDVPRCFVVRHRDLQLFFECVFNDDLDDYSAFYRVFELPNLPDEQLESGSWVNLSEAAIQFLGEVPVTSVKFDATQRQSIEAEVVDDLLHRREEVEAKVRAQLAQATPELANALRAFLVKPYLQMRTWEYAARDSQAEILPCWVIADLRSLSISVGFAYSAQAHGAYGNCWGLVFVNDKYFGMNDSWYRSLEQALIDCGYLKNMLEAN